MLLFVFSTVIVFFWDALFTGVVYAQRDLCRYFIPVWNFNVESLRAGQLPFWNPYIFCGTPQLAHPQTCVFYPPTVLFHLFGVLDGLNPYIAGHVAAAALFMYLWMREWGIGTSGAVLAAFAYALSGSMLSGIGVPVTLCSSAYLPLAMLFLRRTLMHRQLWPAACLALTLLLMFLAGDPIVFFGTSVVIGAFVLCRFFETVVRERRVRPGIVFRPALAMLIFAGCAMFQLLPFLESAARSRGAMMPYTEAAMWSFLPQNWLGLAVPFVHDPEAMHWVHMIRQGGVERYYAGIATLVFGAYALSGLQKRRTVMCLGLAAIAGVMVMGRSTPLYKILCDLVPFASDVRHPVRYFFIVSFAVSCLAGTGFDRFLDSPKEPSTGRGARAFFVLGACSAILVGLLSVAIMMRLHEPLWRLISRGLPGSEDVEVAAYSIGNLNSAMHSALRIFMFLGGTVVAARSYCTRGTDRRAATAIIIGLLLLDMYTANRPSEPFMDKTEFLSSSPIMEELKKDAGLWRVMPSPKMRVLGDAPQQGALKEHVRAGKLRVSTDLNMYFGIPSVSGYESSRPPGIEIFEDRLMMLKDIGAYQALDLVNAKYITSKMGGGLAVPAKFKKLVTTEKADLYQNTEHLPRAFLVEKAEKVPDIRTAMHRVFLTTFRPREVVYIESGGDVLPGGVSGPSAAAAADPEGVTITHYDNLDVRMRISAQGGRWLLLADAYEPNWKAEVNGMPVDVYRADGIFRAVQVPAGESEVRFHYVPTRFYAGSVISALVLLLLAVGLIAERKIALKYVK